MKNQIHVLLEAVRGAMYSLENTLVKSKAFAQEKGISEADFLSKSLAPDQYNFAKQVEIVLDNCTIMLAQASGKEGRPKNVVPTTFEEAFASLSSARDWVATLSEDDFAHANEVKFTFSWMPGKYVTFDERVRFTLANLYFHTVTIYSIARNAGVQLGKSDFILMPQFMEDPA